MVDISHRFELRPAMSFASPIGLYHQGLRKEPPFAAAEVAGETQGDAMKPPYGANTVVMVVEGPIASDDITLLCECLRQLLASSNAELVICDVRALTRPDAVTIDALARLQLTARRLGSQVRLRHACGALQDLLALVGLSEVVPPSGGSRLEPREQAEQRE